MSFSGGRITGVAGTTELFSVQLNEQFSAVLSHLASIGLVGEGNVGRTVLFDWVEVDATAGSVPAFDVSPANTRGLKWLRGYKAGRALEVLDRSIASLERPGR